MSYSGAEQDPLLPKGNRAPEIQTSRPQSIDNVYIVPTSALADDEPPRSRTWNDLMAMLFGLCLALSIVFVILPDNAFDGILPTPTPRTIEERVSRILKDTPLIDGHNDLAILIRFIFDNQIYNDNFTQPFENGGLYSHVDLPRLKKGKNGGAFWSAFVPCPKSSEDGTDYADSTYAESVAFTYTQLDLLRRLQEAYPTHFSPPPNSSTAVSHFKSGQFISPYAIEGLHQIGNSLSNLRHYHSLGARYATLTHNCHNIYADAALTELPGGGIEKAKPLWKGVSEAGRTLITEMNRLGMIVDLAHVSQDTMFDVLGGSKDWSGSAAPIMFSHSSAYSICPHPRNVPDDLLHLVKKTNSIVMVNFSPDFISCTANSTNPSGIPDFYPKNSTLQQVVRHIMHIGDLIGYDHVGLGSDFDGIMSTPKGLEDVSKFPDLVAELLVRGVSDNDAKKIVGENILRVWKDVDQVAERMQKAGVKPAEDKLPSLRGEMKIGRWDE